MSMNVMIRQALATDLIQIEEMAKIEDFHIGVHNWRLYFATSPEYWQVAETSNGEIIGYKVDNLLPGGSAKHAFQLVVQTKHRGQGLTRLFDTMHYSKHKIPCTANATKFSLNCYKFDSFGDRLLGFSGQFADQNLAKSYNVANRVHFQIATCNHLKDILKYDKTVCGFDRSEFVEEWSFPQKFPCYSRSIVAKKDGELCGYGTLREYDGYHVIAPLYADNDDIAERIFFEIANSFLGTSVKFYFLTKSNCRTMINLAQRLKMQCCDDEIRTFRHFDEQKMAHGDVNTIYAMHDFYPV